MTFYHFCFASAEIILKTIPVLTPVEETLSQIKVVKVVSFRQANVSACQSTNSAKMAFFSLSLTTLQCGLWSQFLPISSLDVCRSITMWLTSWKINQHCSHFCSIDANTCTTGKTVQSQNFYSFPKEGFVSLSHPMYTCFGTRSFPRSPHH